MSEFIYITPEQAVEMGLIKPCPGLAVYQYRAAFSGSCEVCGQPWWKIVDTQLCFTCTTGEAEPDDEYELI